jgi:hypothetical protein
MTLNQSRTRLGLAVLAMAVSLAACHHNDDDDKGGGSTPPPVTTTPPPSTVDAFFSYVSQVVANLSDTAEPTSTEGVTATTPENTEPQPLPAS